MQFQLKKHRRQKNNESVFWDNSFVMIRSADAESYLISAEWKSE